MSGFNYSILIREDMFEGFRGDCDIEIAAKVEEGTNLCRFEGSILIETPFVFMDGKDFSDKEIVISIGPDIEQLVFETDICAGQDGGVDYFCRSQLDLKFF